MKINNFFNVLCALVISGGLSTVSAQSNKPNITSINYASVGGAEISIVGTGFSNNINENVVFFGNIKGQVISSSSSQLQVRVPYSAKNAPVTVVNTSTGKSTRSSGNFSQINCVPTAFSFSNFNKSNATALKTNTQEGRLVDFNNDGNLDFVATAVASTANLSLFTNNGQGSFGTSTDFTYQNYPSTFEFADINNDGVLDLISVVNQNSGVTVSLGNNNGFGSPTRFTVGAIPKSIAIADLNNDGYMDIVSGNSNGSSLSILINNATSTVGFTKTDKTLSAGPTDVAIEDIDNNGVLDIIASFGSGFAILNGSISNGVYSTVTNNTASPLNTTFGKIAIGDLNADGFKDLLFTQSNKNYLTYYQSNGTGSFATPISILTATNVQNVYAVDINNDGKLDIVAGGGAAGTPVISVSLGNGNGTFGSKTELSFTGAGIVRNILFTDLNKDNTLDLMLVTSTDYYTALNTAKYQIFASSNSPIEIGAVLNLTTAETGSAFSWTGPNNYSSSISNPQINSTPTSASGTYTLELTKENGCKVTTTTDVLVALGGAFSFDGVNDFATINNSQNLNIGESEFTLNTKIKLNSNAKLTGTIFSKFDNNLNKGLKLELVAGKLQATFQNGMQIASITSVNALNNSNWSNVSLVYNKTLNKASLFVNGVLEASTTNLSGLNFTNSANLFIATDNTTSNFAEIIVDDIRVLKTALCQNEILFKLNCSDNTNASYFSFNFNKGLIGNNNSGISALTDLSSNTTLNLNNVSLTGNVSNFVQGVYIEPCTQFIPSITASISSQDNLTICQGKTVNLTAAGGSIYNWSSGQTTSAISVSPSQTTTYIVTVSNDCGVSNTASVVVTVNPNPTLEIVGSSSICAGSSLDLTANTTASVSWSTLATTNTITLTPSQTTTYTVTATNSFGCTTTSSKAVTVNPLPNTQVSGTSTVCQGVSTTLTASGGNSYLWSNGAITSSINVTPSSTTTYTVTATGSGMCTKSASLVVNVNEVPSATISGPTSVCFGETATLSVPVTNLITWSNGSHSNSITVSPASNTTYVVTVSNQFNCTKTGSVSILVNSLPNNQSVTASATQSTCSALVDFTVGSSQIGFKYYLINNSNNNVIGDFLVGTGSSLVFTGVNVLSTTTFAVKAVDPVTNCALILTNKPTVTITNPIAFVSGTTEICFGQTTTLNVSGGSTYVWSDGGNNSTILGDRNSESVEVKPENTTVYSVTVTTATGCTASSSQTVIVKSLPVVTINGDSILCFGESSTLTANGGVSYAWSYENTESNSIEITLSSTEIYTVTVTGENGCSAEKSIEVVVNELPTANISGDTEVCKGSELTLTASGGVTVLWGENQNTESLTLTPDNSTNYLVTVTDLNGCTASTEHYVTVNELPILTLTSTPGCGETSITSEVDKNVSYSWSNSGNESTISINENGTYTLTVTDDNSCSATASVQAIVYEVPSVTVSGSSSFCVGSSSTLIASSTIESTYEWSNGETTSSITVSEAGDYSVTVTTSNGCTASSDIFNVIENPLPIVSINGNPTICGGSATLAAVGAEQYQWSNNITTSENVVSRVGVYTVTGTDVNGCSATAVVSVINPPANPKPLGNIKANTSNVCTYLGSRDKFVEYSVDTVANVGDYVWTVGEGMIIIEGQNTNTIKVQFENTYNGRGQVKVKASNKCRDKFTAEKTFTASYTLPVAPKAITSITTNVAPLMGTDQKAIYTSALVNGVTQYVWSVSPGATIDEIGEYANGLSQVKVAFSKDFIQGSIQVRAKQECGLSNPTILPLLRKAPEAPVAIYGPTLTCKYIDVNEEVTYNCDAILGVSNFKWTLPKGVIMTDGDGTNSIKVKFTNEFIGGQISVSAAYAYQGKGELLSPKKIINLTKPVAPATPTSIYGSLNICGKIITNDTITYSVKENPNASRYSWTIPTDVELVSGQGTNRIVVRPSTNFITGDIGVTLEAGCGNSALKKIVVSNKLVSPKITGKIAICKQSIELYSVPQIQGLSYTWAVAANGSSLANANTNQVTVNWANVAGKITIVETGCGQTVSSSLVPRLTNCELTSARLDAAKDEIAVYPNPVTTDIFSVQLGNQFEDTQIADITLKVVDMLGRVVYSKQLSDADVINNTVVVSTDLMPNGIYSVSLISTNSSKSKLITINK